MYSYIQHDFVSNFCRLPPFVFRCYCSNREANLRLEATLLDISRKIHPDKYHDLANKLGFTFNNAESVLTTKCNNYGRAAASLLMTWTTENGAGTAQTAILKQIFESTGLGGLVSTLNTEQPPSQMKTKRKISTTTTNFA